MPVQTSRRDFLKIAGLALGAIPWVTAPLPPGEQGLYAGSVRVTVRGIYLYSAPNFKDQRVGMFSRDEILNYIRELISPHGPAHNPRWYQLKTGFVHSAYLQRLDGWGWHTPLDSLPEGGQLGEITVPITRSMRWTRAYDWSPLYRLYYGSMFWITDIIQGPDGAAWYELTDDVLHVKYHIPARHMRPILPDEITPISPGVPAKEKRLEVSIRNQTVTAYEGDTVVMKTQVSTGLPDRNTPPGEIPTDTPTGSFRVQVKVPSRHMGEGELTADIHAYELPGVPWVSFFHHLGIGFHGTYWHDNFGRPMSHGCINMRTSEAKWLYRWALPHADPQEWYHIGNGTRVVVK